MPVKGRRAAEIGGVVKKIATKESAKKQEVDVDEKEDKDEAMPDASSSSVGKGWACRADFELLCEEQVNDKSLV